MGQLWLLRPSPTAHQPLPVRLKNVAPLGLLARVPLRQITHLLKQPIRILRYMDQAPDIPTLCQQ
ncbi:hypothetical protein APS_2267 [Acetobacter pasteurianus subsp. pasteurianus LMG 1262 = NBRC 106471]|nr:hypothetical protein APS_2267 [Acetobacter pasteurianus subsp. pasteurianus LMG 1262 = NBRC 106471]